VVDEGATGSVFFVAAVPGASVADGAANCAWRPF